jgi:hypothetical protein
LKKARSAHRRSAQLVKYLIQWWRAFYRLTGEYSCECAPIICVLKPQ